MTKSKLGRYLWWAAPPVLAVAIASKATNLRQIANALVGVDPTWVLAAVALAAAFTVNQGALYRAIFRIFDVVVSLRVAVRLALVMAFGSLALPAGTAAGIAYFATAAGEQGIAGSYAVLTALAYYLVDFSALLPFAAAGVAILSAHHGASMSLLVAAGLFLLTMATVGGLLLWGLADGRRALRLSIRLARWVNEALARLHRRRPDPQQAANWIDDLRQIAISLRHGRRRLPSLFVYGAGVQVLNLGMLAAAFRAVGTHHVSAGLVLAGYAVGAIFSIVSVTPAGLGVVEAAMALAFISLDIPVHEAVATALLFRLCTFWLPMLAGYAAVRYTRPAPAAHPSTASST